MKPRAGGPVFVTYCSKNKSRRKGLLPAIGRYDSDRIRQVWRASEALGLPFLILSGKYGLLSPADKIPYYDHLLEWEGIGKLLPGVSKRLARERVTAVVYLTRPLRRGSAPLAYHSLMEAACTARGIRFVAIEIEKVRRSATRPRAV
ncbi:MAG: hypothetical protein WC728_02460 [Elusimicrobiota bacterium]